MYAPIKIKNWDDIPHEWLPVFDVVRRLHGYYSVDLEKRAFNFSELAPAYRLKLFRFRRATGKRELINVFEDTHEALAILLLLQGVVEDEIKELNNERRT